MLIDLGLSPQELTKYEDEYKETAINKEIIIPKNIMVATKSVEPIMKKEDIFNRMDDKILHFKQVYLVNLNEEQMIDWEDILSTVGDMKNKLSRSKNFKNEDNIKSMINNNLSHLNQRIDNLIEIIEQENEKKLKIINKIQSIKDCLSRNNQKLSYIKIYLC